MAKKITKKAIDQIIKEKANLFSEDLNKKVNSEEFKTVISKCISAHSIDLDNVSSLEEIKSEIENWYTSRFKPFIFEIDLNTYIKAAISALKIQFLIAGTDFGSSRQRDLGQKWADTIRGYLGEFGIKQWIKNNYNIKVFLGHDKGTLDEYLPQDIHEVEIKGQKREPNIKISIKSTKSNGIWMDIPGAQFNHSDIFILTKLFVSNDHLFSFFKEISVFKDKILKCGINENCIDKDEADKIFQEIPSFKPIIGYIPGFVNQSDYINKIPSFKYEFTPKKAKAFIYNYEGEYNEDIMTNIKQKINKLYPNVKTVEFEGIKNFGKQHKYIFGMKSLRYSKNDWEKYIINKL